MFSGVPALVLGIIDFLLAIALLIWGVVANLWFLILIAVILLVIPFVVMIFTARNS